MSTSSLGGYQFKATKIIRFISPFDDVVESKFGPNLVCQETLKENLTLLNRFVDIMRASHHYRYFRMNRPAKIIFLRVGR